MLRDKAFWEQKLSLTEGEREEFYAYGFAHYQAGHWKEAIEVFRLLCKRGPFERRFWLALAAALQEGQEYREALTAWAMTALLERGDPTPHFHAAECHLSLGEVEEGKKALREALERCSEGDPLKEKIALLQGQWSVICLL